RKDISPAKDRLTGALENGTISAPAIRKEVELEQRLFAPTASAWTLVAGTEQRLSRFGRMFIALPFILILPHEPKWGFLLQ
ncbi:MAG TPA: hypothetical protein PKD27_08645, partial [Tepidiformaceae bacterium]|nr:hypothetical protein [Tepidiformaceae bacterium]